MTQCQSSSATLVEALQSDNENLQVEVAELKAKLTWYEEQFWLYKHKQFGVASERHEGQGNLFNEAEAVDDESTPDDEPETQTVPAHTRKKPVRRSLKDNITLPRTVQIIDLPVCDKQCGCGQQRFPVGDEASYKLKVEPARAKSLDPSPRSLLKSMAAPVKMASK